MLADRSSVTVSGGRQSDNNDELNYSTSLARAWTVQRGRAGKFLRSQPCRTRSCSRRIRKDFQRYRHSLHSFVICDRRILFPFFLHPYLTLPLPCLTAFHTSKSPQTPIMSVARWPSPPFLPSHSLHIALPSPLSASSSSLPPPPPRQ